VAVNSRVRAEDKVVPASVGIRVGTLSPTKVGDRFPPRASRKLRAQLAIAGIVGREDDGAGEDLLCEFGALLVLHEAGGEVAVFGEAGGEFVGAGGGALGVVAAGEKGCGSAARRRWSAQSPVRFSFASKVTAQRTVRTTLPCSARQRRTSGWCGQASRASRRALAFTWSSGQSSTSRIRRRTKSGTVICEEGWMWRVKGSLQ